MSNTHIYIHKSEVDCLLIEEKKSRKVKRIESSAQWKKNIIMLCIQQKNICSSKQHLIWRKKRWVLDKKS